MRDSNRCLFNDRLIDLFVRITTLFSESCAINIMEKLLRLQEKRGNLIKRGGTYGNKLKVPNFPMSEAAFLI